MSKEKSKSFKKQIIKSLTHFNGLLNKLVRNTTLIVVITSFTTIGITLYITKNSVTDDFISSTTRILNQSKQYILLIDRNIESASKRFSEDKMFLKFVGNKNLSAGEKEKIKEKISERLSQATLNSINNMIKSIYYYNDYGISATSNNRDIDAKLLSEIKKSPWYKKAVDLKGTASWSSPHPDIVLPSRSMVFRHTVLLTDVTRTKNYGVLSINLDPDTVNVALSEAKIGKTGYIVMVNQDNYILAHNDPSLRGKILNMDYLKKVQAEDTGSFNYCEKDGTKMFGVFVTYNQREAMNPEKWKFIAIVPERELYGTALEIGFWSIIVMVCFIVLAFFLSMYTSIHISQPIYHIIDKTREISNGNYDAKARSFKVYELNELSTNFNSMGATIKEVMRKLDNKIELVNKELQLAHEELLEHHEEIKKARDAIWGEMQLAKKIQTVLLPEDPRIDGYEIAAYMATADDVGGDYYDVINVDGADWIIIGDVSGHGVPAGLIMMMVQTSIQTVLYQNSHLQPSELLSLVNKTISKNIQLLGESKYMTMTVLAYMKNGEFVFSGLHQDIFIYRGATKNVDVKKTNGMWIGLVDDIKGMIDNQSLKLEVDDTMMLYTDGLTEAVDKSDAMFSEEKLEEIFKNNACKKPEEVKNIIINELKEYKCDDDVTMVLIKRKK